MQTKQEKSGYSFSIALSASKKFFRDYDMKREPEQTKAFFLSQIFMT